MLNIYISAMSFLPNICVNVILLKYILINKNISYVYIYNT